MLSTGSNREGPASNNITRKFRRPLNFDAGSQSRAIVIRVTPFQHLTIRRDGQRVVPARCHRRSSDALDRYEPGR